ncbi:MAG TPA: hypothetical protein VJJ23_04395 [Candidatus Nanoarchaeia archaeon]|nr:hypothetical protein [Candidatus Nanoarchaeia archaeon]
MSLEISDGKVGIARDVIKTAYSPRDLLHNPIYSDEDGAFKNLDTKLSKVILYLPIQYRNNLRRRMSFVNDRILEEADPGFKSGIGPSGYHNFETWDNTNPFQIFFKTNTLEKIFIGGKDKKVYLAVVDVTFTFSDRKYAGQVHEAFMREFMMGCEQSSTIPLIHRLSPSGDEIDKNNKTLRWMLGRNKKGNMLELTGDRHAFENEYNTGFF